MFGTCPMKLHDRTKKGALGFCPDIPRAFECLAEARNSLDYHWNRCIQLLNAPEKDEGSQETRSANLDWELDRQKYRNLCEQWLEAFNAFLLNSGQALTGKAWQAVHVLQISQQFAKTFLDASACAILTNETVWDQYCSRFEDIVLLAASIIGSFTHVSDADVNSQCGPDFCLDMNIIGPLFAVAHKCRHPVVRRKAVSLLYFAPRQEGIWDGVLTARVAERLIEIEEKGLGKITSCDDVPDWARISDVDIKFDLEGRLRGIKYSRQRSPLEKVRDTVEDTLQ